MRAPDYPPTGVKGIDAEHAAIARVLAGHFEAPAGATAAAARTLLALIADHFTSEETLMGEIGYADEVRHRGDHARFLGESTARLRGLRDEENAFDWMQEANRWLHEHVVQRDLWLGLALNDAARWRPG